jgi:hypothetical protein
MCIRTLKMGALCSGSGRNGAAKQLLAVARYNTSYNNSGDAVGRKGAALAAGWLVNAWSWSGEITFGGFYFMNKPVWLNDGETSWHNLSGNSGVPVCAP